MLTSAATLARRRVGPPTVTSISSRLSEGDEIAATSGAATRPTGGTRRTTAFAMEGRGLLTPIRKRVTSPVCAREQ